MGQAKSESKKQVFSRLGWVLILSQLVTLGVVWGAEQIYRLYLGIRAPELDYVSLMRLLQSNGWALMLGAVAGVLPCLKLRLTPRTSQLTGYLTRTRKSISFSMVFVCVLLVMGLQNIASLLTLPMEAAANSMGWSFMDAYTSVASMSDTVSLFLYTVLIAPLCEELVYRGFVLRALAPYGKIFGMVVAALLFGLMHGNIIQLPSALLCGFLFGYVTLEYSLPASILIHTLNNLMAEAMNWLQSADEVTAAAVNQAVFSFGLVALLLYITKFWRPLVYYIRTNRTQKGTLWSFFTTLPVLFLLIYLVILTGLSVTPVDAAGCPFQTKVKFMKSRGMYAAFPYMSGIAH